MMGAAQSGSEGRLRGLHMPSSESHGEQANDATVARPHSIELDIDDSDTASARTFR